MLKKIVVKLFAIGMILGFCGTARSWVYISSTTALDTNTPAFHTDQNESINWYVVGNGSGTVNLARSRNMQNWEILKSSRTYGTVNWSGTEYSEGRSYFYRFQVSTRIAGAFSTYIEDNDDMVKEYYAHDGKTVLTIKDESILVNGNISSYGSMITTNTTAGNSFGQSIPAYLFGEQNALEGSVLVATYPSAGNMLTVAVCPSGLDNTKWIGVAANAASTGTIVNVYWSGFVLARTTGTVNAGDVLVTTNTVGLSGYLGADTTPTTGADMAIAISSGVAAGGLTKVKLR